MITETVNNNKPHINPLEDVKNLIRSKLDIVDFISKYIKLIPSGRTYKSLCPFHNEKTPSFYVVPHKQIFYCFGCGKGGDVIKFYSELEKISYFDALSYLASHLGITNVNEIKRNNEPAHKLILYDLLEEVAKIYANQLYITNVGVSAREYLKKREIDWETAGFFQLGFAPPEGKLLVSRYMHNSDKMKNLLKLGLIRKNQDNSFIDVFRNRIIIPIKDVNGRVIGFGGRSLEQTFSKKLDNINNNQWQISAANSFSPKYINSAESEVFSKRKVLFNISNAIHEIRHKNYAIIVEGYFDAISLYQRGIKNVVAILGTSLSLEQVQLLSRNTENLYLCYDPDEAGKRATLKTISSTNDFAINIKIIKLPNPNEDPDSFIKRDGKENFLRLVENSVDFVTYVVDEKLKDKKNQYTAYEKQKIIYDLRPVVSSVGNPIIRNEIMKKVSQALDIEYEVLYKYFAIKTGTKSEYNNYLQNLLEKKLTLIKLRREEWVIKHLIDDPTKINAVSTILKPSDFSDPLLAEVYKVLLRLVQSRPESVIAAEILENMPDSKLASRVGRLMVSLEDLPTEPLSDCIKGMALSRLERESKEIQNKIKVAEKLKKESEILELQQRLFNIRQEIQKINRNNLIL